MVVMMGEGAKKLENISLPESEFGGKCFFLQKSVETPPHDHEEI
jgi:hypothetical protein